jgi:hypothetical protein
MLRYLFRKWTRIEILAALATFLSLGLSAVPGFTSDPQRPIQVILLAAGGASLLWLLLAISRKAFVVVGNRNVMSFLELLVRHAKLKVWTVRTHTGEGVSEEKYFSIIAERLGSDAAPLEDFRRLLRLAPNAREHVKNLVRSFIFRDFAEVRYFTSVGPQFDFVIVDDLAIIGFPMAGGTNNVAAVVLRHSAVVQAVADVFSGLWEDRNTQVLFRGARLASETDRQAVMALVGRLLPPSGDPPKSGVVADG